MPPAKLRKVVGSTERDGYMYECSRYAWREKRSVCFTEGDRKFSSKRMALLYIAKKNSDAVRAWLEEAGRSWDSACSDKGVHALSPNAPFDLEHFLEMPDEVLERYGRDVGNVLNVHKAPQGNIYRFQAVDLATTKVDELCQILSA